VLNQCWPLGELQRLHPEGKSQSHPLQRLPRDRSGASRRHSQQKFVMQMIEMALAQAATQGAAR